MMDTRDEMVRRAIESNNSQQLAMLLESDPNLASVRLDEETPLLHLAVTLNHVECVRVLLKYTSDVQPADAIGSTPLHYAVQHRPPVVAELLIQQGVDIEAVNSNGDRPIHEAARCDNAEAISLLLRHGAEINPRTSRGFTPLHCTAWEGCPEAANVLLVNRAAPDLPDDDGYIPLNLSLRFNGVQGYSVFGVLLGRTRLLDIYSAIGLGLTSIVRAILKDDSSILRTHPNASDFVSFAIAGGHVELVRVLVECGVDVNKRHHLSLPLIAAMKKTQESSTPGVAIQARHFLELLLAHGANPNLHPAPGEASALEWARQHAPEFVDLLSELV